MEKLLRRYLQFVITRPWTIVALVALITAAAATWLTVFRPLKLDTNFTTLLPDDLPCVVESRRASQLIGSTDYLIVSVESPDPQDNLDFINELAVKLEKLLEVDWVSTKEDKSFFRDHLLLYLEIEDLEDVVGRAKARVAYEKKIANPFYIKIDDEQPPDIAFDDIMDRYRQRLRKQGVRGIIKDKEEPAVDVSSRIAMAKAERALSGAAGLGEAHASGPARPPHSASFRTR